MSDDLTVLTPHLPTCFVGKAPGAVATFETVTFSGKAALFNAANAASLRVEDVPGRMLNVRDVIIHKVTSADDTTGEINEWFAATLILHDGETLRVNSKHAIRSLVSILNQFGIEALRTGNIVLEVKGTVSPRWKKEWYSFMVHEG
jgi:hypothetical protein